LWGEEKKKVLKQFLNPKVRRKNEKNGSPLCGIGKYDIACKRERVRWGGVGREWRPSIRTNQAARKKLGRSMKANKKEGEGLGKKGPKEVFLYIADGAEYRGKGVTTG